MLYYSASSTWRRSCIGLLVSKKVYRDYKYVDTILYSGFTNTGKVNYDGNSRRDTTWSNNYLHLKILMNNGIIDNNLSTWKCFNRDGSWNNNYAPNAIDPTIFYNSVNKQLFMTYGSWSGGIFLLELDVHSGLPKYPGKDGVDSTSGNFYDRYFGTILQEVIIYQVKDHTLNSIKTVDFISCLRHMGVFLPMEDII